MNRALVGCALLAAMSLPTMPPARAAVTQRWSASTESEFARGTLDGAAIDEQGRVVLAPERATLWGPEEGIVWDLAPATPDGAFIALSGPGRLIRATVDGTRQSWFSATEEGLVTAVAADGGDGAYIGLSPEGRVLHVTGVASSAELFATGAKFIWSLARAADGALWAGTGVPGRLMRHGPDGTVETLFESGDDPVRCIAFEANGNAVIGTGGRGRIIRVTPAGRAFVLFDADEPEIVDLTVDEDGTVHALTALAAKQVTGQRGSVAQPTGQEGNVVRVVVTPTAEEELDESGTPPPPAQPQEAAAPPRFKAVGGGALYRIAPDGDARKVWNAGEAMPFAILRDPAGRLLVASGDEGKIFTFDERDRAAQLLRVPAEQASALAVARGGQLLVGGTTDARVDLLGPGRNPGGRYLTPAVDAGRLAAWGRLRWEAELPRGTKLALEARSGNTAEPDETWSEWIPLEGGPGAEGSETNVPPARWFQARLRMSAKGQASPAVSRLEVVFTPRNRAPEIQTLNLELPGIVLLRGPMQANNLQGPLVADDPVSRQAAAALQRNMGNAVRRAYEAGVRSVTWNAVDPDEDRLRYLVEIRREEQPDWLPLARDLEETFLSFDARALPDGLYRLRLTADDLTDNSWELRETDSQISQSFLVDNSRPAVEQFRVARGPGGPSVSFVARDQEGQIAAVEIAVNAGAWTPVEPQDGVADSNEERYTVRLEHAPGGAEPRSLSIRVTDTAGNIGGELALLSAD